MKIKLELNVKYKRKSISFILEDIKKIKDIKILS